MLTSTLLFTLLSTLTLGVSAAHNPPHLRHRDLVARLPESIAARVNEEAPRALSPRTPSDAHREAARAIKRNLKLRKRQAKGKCATTVVSTSASPSPTPTPSTSTTSSTPASSDAPASSDIGNGAWAQNQANVQPSSSTEQASSSPSPSASAHPKHHDNGGSNNGGNNGGNSGGNSGDNNGGNSGDNSGSSGGNSGVSVSVGGLLNLNIGACGWCGSSPDSPNGSEDWLNCNIASSGWQPPQVSVSDLKYAQLDGNGPFSACSAYIDKFNSVGQQMNLPPILLAAFAMQESTCNAGATGRNGEAGLMQITPDNCNRLVPGQNCWDVDVNINAGATIINEYLASSGGNVIATVGNFNGWYAGMTVGNVQAQGICSQRQNLDYLNNMFNYWMQNKTPGGGQYGWLSNC